MTAYQCRNVQASWCVLQRQLLYTANMPSWPLETALGSAPTISACSVHPSLPLAAARPRAVRYDCQRCTSPMLHAPTPHPLSVQDLHAGGPTQADRAAHDGIHRASCAASSDGQPQCLPEEDGSVLVRDDLDALLEVRIQAAWLRDAVTAPWPCHNVLL
jgi:hypothetical protein